MSSKRFPFRVTAADLPPVPPGRTLPGGGYLEPVRQSLHCPRCGASFSADPGDYWSTPADHVFRCACPGRPLLMLGRAVERFEAWSGGPDAR